MKIDNKILSLPPYISTQWKHVEGLYLRGATLVVALTGGESVNIPGLNTEILRAIFAAHADYLEDEAQHQPITKTSIQQMQELPFGLPVFSQTFMMPGEGSFQFGISTMDGLAAMQHNPAQANAPDLPAEVLQKIGAIVKIVAPEEVLENTSAVQHCNCPHCQITRAITGEPKTCYEVRETPFQYNVSKEPWKIEQMDETTFTVSGQGGEFRVTLGNPVTCTCGEDGCEHIIAVLRS